MVYYFIDRQTDCVKTRYLNDYGRGESRTQSHDVVNTVDYSTATPINNFKGLTTRVSVEFI